MIQARAQRPVIAVSLGDPAGIGPEVTLKALAQPWARRADWTLFGALRSLPRAWRAPRGVSFVLASSALRWPKRVPSVVSGQVAFASVLAAHNAVRMGWADALVTAPLSKTALRLAGVKHAGHTELLASLAGLRPTQVGMLLVGGGLRVFLVTRHLGLRQAINVLRPKVIQDAARICADGLRQRFGIVRPRLALAALNPHAGEAGAFGDQERRVLLPALRRLRSLPKATVSGPYPADTVFVHALRGDFDAVLCLYHDQGLIPLKLLAFTTGVNVTLGLPYFRSSPDHGTAYDIAGKGVADPASMSAALRLALAQCAL